MVTNMLPAFLRSSIHSTDSQAARIPYYAIAHGSAPLFYQNLSKGNWQPWDDAVTANSGGWFWAGDDYKFTKTGIVYSYIFGDVLLDNGSICSIDFPTDTETIH
jgi:hypothetical protein